MSDLPFSDRLADHVETGGLRSELPPLADQLHEALHAEAEIRRSLLVYEWQTAEQWERKLRRWVERRTGALWLRACDVIEQCDDWERHRKLINSILIPLGMRVRRVQQSNLPRITIHDDHYGGLMCRAECDHSWPRLTDVCQGCNEHLPSEQTL